MQTTIQINDKTLHILRKLKEETNSSSYDEAINKIVADRSRNISLAGFLGKKPINSLLKNLREKHERF